MRALIILAAGSLALSTAAIAGDTGDADEDKVICKRVLDTNTGSNFRGKSKVCRKASDWKEIEDSKNRTLRRARDAGGLDPNREQTFGASPG